jgi:hypothetical protein
MFEAVRALFLDYCQHLATYAAEGYESEYRLEVDQRLDQMEFMQGRVKGLLIRSFGV